MFILLQKSYYRKHKCKSLKENEISIKKEMEFPTNESLLERQCMLI